MNNETQMALLCQQYRNEELIAHLIEEDKILEECKLEDDVLEENFKILKVFGFDKEDIEIDLPNKLITLHETNGYFDYITLKEFEGIGCKPGLIEISDRIGTPFECDSKQNKYQLQITLKY